MLLSIQPNLIVCFSDQDEHFLLKRGCRKRNQPADLHYKTTAAYAVIDIIFCLVYFFKKAGRQVIQLETKLCPFIDEINQILLFNKQDVIKVNGFAFSLDLKSNIVNNSGARKISG